MATEHILVNFHDWDRLLPSLLHPLPPHPLKSMLPSPLPLEISPLIPLWRSGSALSAPSGVQAKHNAFCAFSCSNTHLVTVCASLLCSTNNEDGTKPQSYWDKTQNYRDMKFVVWKCIHGVAPPYLQEVCVPVEKVQGRPRLRSVSTRCVDLPKRSFAFHGPTVRNSLPLALRDSSLSLNTFKRRLKTHLFGQS